MHPSYREHKELARRLLYKALGVSKSSEATSIPRVSTERPHLFNQDPIAHGPGSGSAGLEISGASLRQWRDSAWNRALVVVLVSRAQAIECSYPGRFGSHTIDWHALFSDRLYRILLRIRRELAGSEVYARNNWGSARRGTLVMKHKRRLQIATVMFDRCTSNEDIQGTAFWSFVLRAVSDLGPCGMSDEEDDKDIGSGHLVKKVMAPSFRHEAFCELFKWVDGTRSRERNVFVGKGAKRLERVADPRVVSKPAPHTLPPSFLVPSYRAHGVREMVFDIENDDSPSEFLGYVSDQRSKHAVH
ncbi:hypothetical protein AAF712_012924 [Marasmius tenuissimus]|uniref:Uncharacterized protein n=1 Tax=Marasmius tenuissimus TaxID=585030 RepID=A0ABR2ZH78_9AGAR